MTKMFLRTRLHMYLLWSTCIFAFLAVITGLITDSGSTSVDTTVSASSTTTTVTPTSSVPARQYTVLPGESLYNIAQKFNLSAPALVELNRIKNPDQLSAGTVLLLPPSNGFVPIGQTTTMPP